MSPAKKQKIAMLPVFCSIHHLKGYAMKKLILASAVSGRLAAVSPRRRTQSRTTKSASTPRSLSDYRYRGISQTRLEPALQGGADYTHNRPASMLGTWLSTIKWTKDAGRRRRCRMGYLRRQDAARSSRTYPMTSACCTTSIRPTVWACSGFTNANTTEIYGQIGYGPAYIKYSHALTNLFGTSTARTAAISTSAPTSTLQQRLHAEPACRPPDA